jgi:hypothetical protein
MWSAARSYEDENWSSQSLELCKGGSDEMALLWKQLTKSSARAAIKKRSERGKLKNLDC